MLLPWPFRDIFLTHARAHSHGTRKPPTHPSTLTPTPAYPPWATHTKISLTYNKICELVVLLIPPVYFNALECTTVLGSFAICKIGVRDNIWSCYGVENSLDGVLWCWVPLILISIPPTGERERTSLGDQRCAIWLRQLGAKGFAVFQTDNLWDIEDKLDNVIYPLCLEIVPIVCFKWSAWICAAAVT